ncbi:hypothetical protein AB0I84_19000 [Streptomyces spectabilis]|uniref:hypothetical protein n=1 Tax=Streptomyces spectabilis TaxID=68270 RepID=UPI0033E81959
MKSLLWLVLALGVLVNAVSGLVFDGAQQTVVSVITGIAVVVSITGLVLARERHS